MKKSIKNREEFEKLEIFAPHWLKDCRDYAVGSNGIAVIFDNAVRKVLFNHTATRDHALNQLERETLLLEKFQELDFYREVPLPSLLSAPEIFDHTYYLASYTMSRLHDQTLSQYIEDIKLPEQRKNLLNQTGTMIARFHAALQNHDIGDALPHGPIKRNRILTCDALDETANRQLEAADIFFQASKKAGVIHGDLNAGNIMIANNAFGGFIDFSHTGKTDNIMAEFAIMDTQTLPAILEGYERETGARKTEFVVAATRLALWTSIINDTQHLRPDHNYRKIAASKIKEELATLEPVLGL